MSTTIEQLSFVVVDPSPDDYAQLMPMIEELGVVTRFYATGEAAMRSRADPAVVCWMINLQLPDMTGLQLLELLEKRIGNSFAILVADRYQPEAEVSVLCLGNAHFACKPIHPAWLQKTLSQMVREYAVPRPATQPKSRSAPVAGVAPPDSPSKREAAELYPRDP